MKILRNWNAQRPLRKWQTQAIRRFYALNKTDFLAVGTPGSGKTDFALRIAHDLLTDGKVKRVVVVAPTEHLKKQWAEHAARCGINIDPNWMNSNGCETEDYLGVAVTYQQVSFAPDLYDLNCRHPTLVIFDEIHHAGDGLDWGVKLRVAFGNAVYRLSLSGTPFRNDGNQIPFVAYENRRSCADFIYSYGEALADGVCRPMFFPTVEGNVMWIRGSGEKVNHSMLEGLPRQKSAERLRAALDSEGEWLLDVLQQADNRLTEMRFEGHVDAADLIIAIDQYHARKIAELLKTITNEEATIAISDEENSSRMIQNFAQCGNHRRWIVAVKMVSEGVDIPRLRVGVYATTVLSELFFRQAVGRFVRIIPGIEEQSAAFYLPADETLIRHALAIKEERDHFLPEIIKAEKSIFSNQLTNLQTNNSAADLTTCEANANADSANSQQDIGCFPCNHMLGENVNNESSSTIPTTIMRPQSVQSGANDVSSSGTKNGFIIPLSSEARPHDTIFDGMRFSDTELIQAETIGKELGVKLPTAQVATIIRRVTDDGNSHKNSLQNNPSQMTNSSLSESINRPKSNIPIKFERKDKLRKRINNFANRLARLTNNEFDFIHRRWIQEMNGKANREATEEELNRKLTWLQNQISEFYRTQKGR